MSAVPKLPQFRPLLSSSFEILAHVCAPSERRIVVGWSEGGESGCAVGGRKEGGDGMAGHGIIELKMG